MNHIESNEKQNFSLFDWKGVIIILILIGIFAVVAPMLTIFPILILLVIIVQFLWKRVNIQKFGEIKLYYNEGLVRLGGDLEVTLETAIPYDDNIDYWLTVQNIKYTHYKNGDRENRKHKVLVELEEKGTSYNRQGNTTIKAKIKMPKEGRLPEYIAKEYSRIKFNRVSYYWELGVHTKEPNSLNFKRTFKIEVIEKMGDIRREVKAKSRRGK